MTRAVERPFIAAIRDLFPGAADHPLTQVDERILITARHGIGQSAQLDGKLVQMLGQRRDSHEAAVIMPTATKPVRNNKLPNLPFGDAVVW
jgi:hypothetical protein